MATFVTQDYRLTISETSEDLSLASTLKIRVKKPDLSTFEQTATFGGTGNQNASIDISGMTNDSKGKWFAQVEAIIDTKKYLSEYAEVTVLEEILDPTP